MSRARQPILESEGAVAGYSIELDVDGDPRAALARLAAKVPPGTVIGLGQPLCEALSTSVPGLRALSTRSARATLPATQHALWAFVAAASTSEAFDRARALDAALRGGFRLVEQTPLFRYRDGRDLSGYVDGTANPTGDEAVAAAFVGAGALEGASFAYTGRFVHDLAAFEAMPRPERDHVIGRAHADNQEIEEAPETAHVKRTAMEEYDPPATMVRRSMPFGDLRRHGLQFVAFAADLDRFDRMLRRMVGGDDERADALFRFTRAETGAYYLCPPLADGRLDLSVVGFAM